VLRTAVARPRQLPLDARGIGGFALEPAAIGGTAGQFAEQFNDRIETDARARK
jgi:hypothetical protein